MQVVPIDVSFLRSPGGRPDSGGALGWIPRREGPTPPLIGNALRLTKMSVVALETKENALIEKKESYTPIEAKRVLNQLEWLVSEKALTARQAGAYRAHITKR